MESTHGTRSRPPSLVKSSPTTWLDAAGYLCVPAIVVALGGNLGSRAVLQTRFDSAIAALSEQWGPSRVSPVYASSPVGDILDQPGFLNAVATWLPAAELAPGQVLKTLQQLEDKHGRERKEKGGPRTLDLDLLLMGGLEVSSEQLQLPHPRMAERAFVLKPLRAIFGPDFRWLKEGRSISEYLASPALHSQECAAAQATL